MPPVFPRNPYLQLSQGESTSSSYTAVVLDSWASDDWSQLVDWAGCDSCRLRKTGITASELTAWLNCMLDPSLLCHSCAIYLVEVNSDSSLPILTEICRQLGFVGFAEWRRKHTVMRNLLVVLDRHCVGWGSSCRVGVDFEEIQSRNFGVGFPTHPIFKNFKRDHGTVK